MSLTGSKKPFPFKVAIGGDGAVFGNMISLGHG